LSAAQGARQIREQIEKGKSLVESGAISSEQEQAWRTGTQYVLVQAFGSGSHCVKDVMSVNEWAFAFGGGNPEAWAAQRITDMKARITIMEGLADLLESQADEPPSKVIPVPVLPASTATNEIVLTWSGRTSHVIASSLYEWLPLVIPGAKTWISTEDIAKGDRWFPELMSQLGRTTTCVISVTPENHKAPWVYYEAGVIAAKQEHGKICTVLFGVTTKNIKDTPLAQFQATEADKDDIWRLVRSINRRLARPNDEQAVRALYEKHWPTLKQAIDQAVAKSVVPLEGGDTLDLLSEYRLSEDAKQLLREACKSKQGKFYWNHNNATGYSLSTNEREFIDGRNPRETAKGKAMLDELVGSNLIEDRWHKGEIFAVTDKGFQIGDML
jgi:hypothetical protein